MDASNNESFLSWEKKCENLNNDSAIEENADKENIDGGLADDESEVSNDPEKIKKYLPHNQSLSPQRGSCDYITNLLDPNSAIVELNDTLDAVNYILEHGFQNDEEEINFETMSSISISSDDSSILPTKSLKVKTLEDETEPLFDSLTSRNISQIKSP